MRELSLAAGVLPEFQPEDVAEAGAAAGYSNVGFTIEPEAWTSKRTAALRSRLASLDLHVLDVEVIWIGESGALTDGDRVIVDAGAELGAKKPVGGVARS